MGLMFVIPSWSSGPHLLTTSLTVAGNPEALARFERESHAIAAHSHPNILRSSTSGTATDIPTR